MASIQLHEFRRILQVELVVSNSWLLEVTRQVPVGVIAQVDGSHETANLALVKVCFIDQMKIGLVMREKVA